METEKTEKTVETWKDRVVAERIELAERLSKLQVFIGSKGFEELDEINQQLLLEQNSAMFLYFNALSRRIEYNSDN